jgi:membrane associated rhomboid family serine protease
VDIVAAVAVALIIGAFVYAFVRRAPLSMTIAIAAIAIYALLATTSRFWGDPSWSEGYAQLVLVTGTWKLDVIPSFFTTMFVHQNLLHLGFNMAALIFVGAALEDRIGTLAFALIFVVGGLIGGLTFYLIHYGQVFIVLGASGAISGELGAYARLYPREKVTLFVPGLMMPAIPVFWLAIGFILISSLLIYVIPGIAFEAHIGGLIAGFFMAPVAGRLTKKKESRVTMNLDKLEPLATTAELKEMLAKMKAEKIPEVREAWVEPFLEHARCPRCGKRLWEWNEKAISECGWKLRLR